MCKFVKVSNGLVIYIYIYIYRERERERLVANPCDAREQLLNDIQEKKKPLFLNWSNKQKMHEIYIYF